MAKTTRFKKETRQAAAAGEVASTLQALNSWMGSHLLQAAQAGLVAAGHLLRWRQRLSAQFQPTLPDQRGPKKRGRVEQTTNQSHARALQHVGKSLRWRTESCVVREDWRSAAVIALIAD